MITKHSLDPQDAITMAKLRPMLASTKGSVTGPAARPPFDELMEQTPPADSVARKRKLAGCPDGGAGRTAHPPMRPCFTFTGARTSLVRRKPISILWGKLLRGQECPRSSRSIVWPPNIRFLQQLTMPRLL